MIWILGQNAAKQDWENRIKVNADWYFADCYFHDLDDATAFFTALHYPRFLWSFMSGVVKRLVSWRLKPRGHALNDIELDFVALSVEQSSGESQEI